MVHARSETVVATGAATELAGLADLAQLDEHDARLRTLMRIAATLDREDRERQNLRWAGGRPVRIEGDPSVFASLSTDERRRLIVRVLCELVAYGEDASSATPVRGTLAASAP